MTVIVGVLCQDGVVVGSDSSMTFTAGQLKTVEQSTDKTFVIGPDVLIAGTGFVGLMQRFQEVVATLRDKKTEWGSKNHLDVAKNISRATLEDFQSTKIQQFDFGAIVAFPVRNAYHLYEFSSSNGFQPEYKTPTNWFSAMGSGQPIVDPFFGLLCRTLFKGKQPYLPDGIFAALWALSHVIELNTGGINGPAQVGTLTQVGKNYQAKRLSLEELAEHQSHVDAVEKHLANYYDQLRPKQSAGQQPPKPPEAPLG